MVVNPKELVGSPVDRSAPTYENQLYHAHKLLQDKGLAALENPHAMIGRGCKCGDCFCCAAAQVSRDYRRVFVA